RRVARSCAVSYKDSYRLIQRSSYRSSAALADRFQPLTPGSRQGVSRVASLRPRCRCWRRCPPSESTVESLAMRWLDAAEKVLRDTDTPLNYNALTQLILNRHLVETQ